MIPLAKNQHRVDDYKKNENMTVRIYSILGEIDSTKYCRLFW